MESVKYEGKMEEQGGGHGLIRRCKLQPGNIPCISKPVDHFEAIAYKELQNTPLKKYIPKFYGIHKEGSKENIIMEDLTLGFKSPCMGDFKVGTRHYDINATEEKKNIILSRQKGSTTESIGVRLTDAKIRQNGAVVEAWSRKQGFSFTYDQLEEAWSGFLPTPHLREEVTKKLDELYTAFDETVEKYPGFRMYSSSIFIAYDGDDMSDKSELRVRFIDLAHAHINIADEGCDLDDEIFDDGVLQGISSLMNFQFKDVPKLGTRSLTNDGATSNSNIQFVDDIRKHKTIRPCILNPGGIKCYKRGQNPHESEAYTQLSNTSLLEFLPKLYQSENNSIIVENICGNYSSPCISDFKVGRLTFDLDDSLEKKAKQRAKDENTTTKTLRVRLVSAIRMKSNKIVKEWTKANAKEDINKNDDKLKDLAKEFIEPDLKSKVLAQLVNIKKAYEKTVKENPNFRIYNASVVIAYDGDNLKKEPRCALTRTAGTHIDIQKEKYNPKNAEYDDGFIEGLDNLIKLI